MGVTVSNEQESSLVAPSKAPVEWHEGELEMHKHNGQNMDDMTNFLRRWMPQQHRQFFCSQGSHTVLFLGSLDSKERPWASVLFPPKGSVTSPNDRELIIQENILSPLDPFSANIAQQDAKVGLLGMEFHTRRRNRMNGTVTSRISDQFVITVDHGFGNCPKYIQGRAWEFADKKITNLRAERTTTLSPDQRRLIQKADSFWIASAYLFDKSNPASGVDMSHRGGNPGFVQVFDKRDQIVLKWPDYRGNNMFQTLGNISKNPKAGLLFIDFETSSTLQLTGRARVLHDEKPFEGSLRMVEFILDEALFIDHGLPVTFAPEVDLSPYNPPVNQPRKQLIGKTGLDRISLFCANVQTETFDCKTFQFASPRRLEIIPGQFGSFEFKIKNELVVRTWTLSSQPSDYLITITVKRKPQGLASNWILDNMQIGGEIVLTGISGDFTLQHLLVPASTENPSLTKLKIESESQPKNANQNVDNSTVDTVQTNLKNVNRNLHDNHVNRISESSDETPKMSLSSPILMIAAGVGITPIRAMISGLTKARIANAQITLLYGSSAHNQIIFEEQLGRDAEELQKQGSHLNIFHAISQAENDISATKLKGRISLSLIQRVCPDYSTRQVYLCGPEPFLQDMETQLLEVAQIPSSSVHLERFNF